MVIVKEHEKNDYKGINFKNLYITQKFVFILLV